MRKGWEVKKLGELCKLTRGHNPPKSKFINEPKDGYVRFYQIRDGWSDDYVVFVPDSNKLHKVVSEDILMVAYRHIGKVFRGVTGAFNVALCKISNKNKTILDNDYLFYIIPTDIVQGELMKRSERSLIPSMSVEHLKEIEIPLPPIQEQQRIVAVLDEAFTAIDKAKANTEQNLKNAKELFESELQRVFSEKGDGWEEKKLEDCFKMKSGYNLTSKMMSDDGIYPVFGGNGIAGLHNDFNLEGSNVIIGRVGALCGNVRHLNEKIWLTDNAFKIVDEKFDFDNAFLTYLLNFKDLRSYARQAAQPVISNSSLKDVVLNFPKSLKEQQTIVSKLDALREQTKKLEAVYEKKLQDLEELKKSVLQKAFSGEL